MSKSLVELLDDMESANWGKSMGHGIFSAEFFKEIPELYESLPPAKQQEIDGVFLEQPDIRERIKRMEWTVLDLKMK